VLLQGTTLDDAMKARITAEIRKAASPRHVPSEIVAVPAVPRTLSGKKLEVPIKRMLLGEPIERIVNPDAMADPASLDWYVEFAAKRLRRD
jgi:acetoacetyl-CoA synthetase